MKVKVGDILLCGLVLLFAGVLFFAFTAGPGRSAEIYQHGVLIRQLSLDEDARIEITGDYHYLIEVRDGKIGFIAANCPDQTCVHTGMIQSAGASALCLPGRIEIRITGDKEAQQPDVIT